MKLRYILLFALVTLALTACNLTLAEDVTPPPDYVPPTPMPDLGQLYPAQAPSVENGAAIYVEKCAPCHGDTGLGDGEQGIQLGVTVRAFGLPEIARAASPEQYYTSVTRGNIERFMPPFNSLNDQQRWEVVSYVLTLHTTPEQIAKGKELFETNCADCSTDFFKNQEKMSDMSAVDLARLIRQGSSEVPAFAANLEDNDLWLIAAYLRTLSFDFAPLAQPTIASVTQTPVAADAGTPSAEGTPIGTEQAAVEGEATPVVIQEGFGTISGSIENKTGAGLPSDLVITLRGFDHGGTDPNAGPQEILTEVGVINTDGTFTFENIELPEGRIFLVETEYSGISLQSDFVIVENGQTALSVPPIALYELTRDTSALVLDELHVFVQVSSETQYEILALYTFRNTGESVIAVEMTAQQQEISFLKFPIGSEGLGYEAVQDSAPFISMNEGFAMAPNELPYGILAFSSVAIGEKETTVTQEFVMPATAVRIFVPDGMEAQGDNLTTESPQDVQGTVYQSYVANNIKAGEALTFTVSGTPKTIEATDTATSSNNTLLIAAGGLGIGLILVGAWMYYRDRQRTQADDDEENDEGDEEDEFESSEEVMDAILALDDLHRAKKIAEDAYQNRRAELKEILKGMM